MQKIHAGFERSMKAREDIAPQAVSNANQAPKIIAISVVGGEVDKDGVKYITVIGLADNGAVYKAFDNEWQMIVKPLSADE